MNLGVRLAAAGDVDQILALMRRYYAIDQANDRMLMTRRLVSSRCR